AQIETSWPSLIAVRNHIGYGSPKQDTAAAHGEPLGPEAVKETKRKLGWPLEPEFYIPAETLAHFREAIARGKGSGPNCLQPTGGRHRNWQLSLKERFGVSCLRAGILDCRCSIPT